MPCAALLFLVRCAFDDERVDVQTRLQIKALIEALVVWTKRLNPEKFVVKAEGHGNVLNSSKDAPIEAVSPRASSEEKEKKKKKKKKSKDESDDGEKKKKMEKRKTGDLKSGKSKSKSRS